MAVMQRWVLVLAAALVGVIVLANVAANAVHTALNQPDEQCRGTSGGSVVGVAQSTTAAGWLAAGDRAFDSGDCESAVAAYTRAIALDPNDPALYNNRGYARMRMRQFEQALPDLDRAIELRPTYVNALMNRGDVHNYYLVDRRLAIADYDRVIALGPAAYGHSSICGHRQVALNGGWGPRIYVQLLLRGEHVGCEL
jgi:tetratricopeptide (TPR) repeat protein